MLEHEGVPTLLKTDFDEDIVNGSICIDTLNGDMYILKGVSWVLLNGNSGTSGSGGNVDISYIRAQPTKISLGGMPSGTIPNFAKIQDLLDTVLYPFTPPSISLSSSSLHEKGSVVSKSMNYNISLNNGIVLNRGIYLNNFLEFSPISNSGTYNSPSLLTWNNSPNGAPYYTHNFNFRVNFTNSGQLNSGISVQFAPPTYYGVLNIGSVNETNIKTLTKSIRTKANDSQLFSPVLKRYVYAYPASYGNLVSIIDPNGFNITAGFTKTNITFTLIDSSSEIYNVYVSNSDTTQTNFRLNFNF